MKTKNACPFCGHDTTTILSPTTTPEPSDNRSGYQVQCVNCGARGPFGMASPELAIGAWEIGDLHYRRPFIRTDNDNKGIAMRNLVEVEWFPVDTPPPYEFQVGGRPIAASLILALDDGGVWPGDYTDGQWAVFGTQVPQTRVVAWCRFPRHPSEEAGKTMDRLLTLASKHCPKDHHDWQEILCITQQLGADKP